MSRGGKKTEQVGSSSSFVCWVTQLCLTLCDPMNSSQPGSSVHEIFQAIILRVDCYFLLQGILPIQGSNSCLLHLLNWQVNSLPLHHPKSSKLVLDMPWVTQVSASGSLNIFFNTLVPRHISSQCSSVVSGLRTPNFQDVLVQTPGARRAARVLRVDWQGIWGPREWKKWLIMCSALGHRARKDKICKGSEQQITGSAYCGV